MTHSNQFLEGSVVVITGASSGMGRELTLRYADRQCKLVIGARRLEELEKLRKECFDRFGNKQIVCVRADVSKEEDAKLLIDTAVENFGPRIDLLLLCAGISAHSNFEDFPDMEPFRKVIETNLYGCAYPTRHALKYMKSNSKLETKGHIAVLSSYSGEFGLQGRSCYSASKFAVNGFFESLRMELGDKIDITVVCPITVQTGFREYSLIKPENKAEDSPGTTSMTAAEAVDCILEAIDYRVDKYIFPFKQYLAVPLRHFFPKTVEGMVKSRSKL